MKHSWNAIFLDGINTHSCVILFTLFIHLASPSWQHKFHPTFITLVNGNWGSWSVISPIMLQRLKCREIEPSTRSKVHSLVVVKWLLLCNFKVIVVAITWIVCSLDAVSSVSPSFYQHGGFLFINLFNELLDATLLLQEILLKCSPCCQMTLIHKRQNICVNPTK